MKIFFEKCVPKKIHYLKFWIIISLLFFITFEILVSYLFEKKYFTTSLLFCLGFGVIPVTLIYFKKRFNKLFKEIKNVSDINTKKLSFFINNWEIKIFSLRTFSSLFFSFFISGLALLTLLSLNSPFENKVLKILFYIIFIIISFFFGKMAHSSFQMMFFLKQISRLDFNKVPFLRILPPFLTRSQNFFYGYSFVFLIMYLGLFLSFWKSPYGLNLFSILWLGFVALVPTTSYILINFYYLKIHNTIKNNFLNDINNQIVNLRTSSTFIKNSHIENIKQLFDLQQSVQKIRLNNLTPERIIVLISTSGVGIAQIILSYIKLMYFA